MYSFRDVRSLHCGGSAYTLARERDVESRYRYCRHAAGKKRIPVIRKGKHVSPLALAILVAICLFISSGCLMLALTLLQSIDVPIAIRLLTLAVLPGPLLFLCMGLLAWVFTNSLLWAIGIGIASYILAMATALQVQKIIVNLWNRMKRMTQ